MNETSYVLLDCGDGRRLERFGRVVVDRPAPAAAFPRALSRAEWSGADLCFDREGGWRGEAPGDWRVAFGVATLLLHSAPAGQVGAFPEHAVVSKRIEKHLAATRGPDGGWRVLNLFAHTGLASLRLAARADVAIVAHVDAAPSAVRRARENAGASGLGDASIRWLVDDVLSFLRREERRGSRHDLILADPPAYGRRKGGGEWKLERDLPELLETAGKLLPERGGALCLTWHSEGGKTLDVPAMVADVVPRLGAVSVERLVLRPDSGGCGLPAGEMLLAAAE
jgi:23S rRNA (cytosine1962-C5)-methyltransferase